jgi:hypothetical protein
MLSQMRRRGRVLQLGLQLISDALSSLESHPEIGVRGFLSLVLTLVSASHS